MTKSELMTNEQMTSDGARLSSLRLRHSFVIGHSSFVVSL
jgi:hypothetical protein